MTNDNSKQGAFTADAEREQMEALLEGFDISLFERRDLVIDLIAEHIHTIHYDFSGITPDENLLEKLRGELNHLSNATLSALAHELKGID